MYSTPSSKADAQQQLARIDLPGIQSLGDNLPGSDSASNPKPSAAALIYRNRPAGSTTATATTEPYGTHLG